MSTPQVQNPLIELRDTVVQFAGRCRAMQWFGALFNVEVVQDIVADVVKHEQDASEKAHAAEVYALEARRAMEKAQAPESDGGCNITPSESEVIARLIASASEQAHNATEALVVA